MKLNADDTRITIDLLIETLDECLMHEVVDFSEYLAKNLAPATLKAFKEGINSVKS